jgi:hypothetical protein
MGKPATLQHKLKSRSSSSEIIARRLASHEDSSEEEYSEEEDDVFHSAKESLDLSEGELNLEKLMGYVFLNKVLKSTLAVK